MKRLYHSILYSAIDRYGSLIFFFVSTGVLARLLSPAEFGVYAVVNALTTIAGTSFQEFGGSNYLIQKPSLTERDIRTAFTIVFALSAVFTAGLLFLRGPIATFFAQKGIETALLISCLNFLIFPFSLTITALLRRDLSFGALARCNLAGSVVSAVASIALAIAGFSFLAPVIGTVAGNATTAVCFIAVRKNLGIFRPCLEGYEEVVHFGAYSSAVVLVNVFYNMAPQLLLARVLNFNAAGLYSRATSITQVFDRLVLQVTTPVIEPAIFAHSRAGGDLKRAYLRTIESISALQWPFLAFMALLADPIIWIWLGPTWSDVVPLIRMLSVGSLALFAAYLTYPMLVAAGRIKDTLTVSLITLPPSFALMIVASFFGVEAVAGTALVSLPLQAAVAGYYVGRQIGLTLIELAQALLKSSLVTLCTVGGASMGMVLSHFSHSARLAELLISAMLAAAAWTGSLLLIGHPFFEHARSLISGFRLKSIPNGQLASLDDYLTEESIHADKARCQTGKKRPNLSFRSRQSLRLCRGG
ncbi:MAG: lipopolysaccharide biosynthesis protein [Bradyrhizobium sp.]|nr:lipopolysaccharide biosynthesis protein [Bradyrhizobium sp.]